VFLEHHIIIISVGSCDTKDWSNDAVTSALITGINYTSPDWYTLQHWHWQL